VYFQSLHAIRAFRIFQSLALFIRKFQLCLNGVQIVFKLCSSDFQKSMVKASDFQYSVVTEFQHDGDGES
jgi:hypothetical protein